MIKYMILVDESCVLLMEAVREHLPEGWRPQGGIAVGYRDEWEQKPPAKTNPRSWALPKTIRRMYWAQAMIREGETK